MSDIECPVWVERGSFHFVFYWQEGQLHAHCLETDTVATGDTLVEAMENLQTAITMEIAHATRKRSVSGFWDDAPEDLHNLLITGMHYVEAIHRGNYPGFESVPELRSVDTMLNIVARRLDEAGRLFRKITGSPK